jgi:hypothetical protein
VRGMFKCIAELSVKNDMVVTLCCVNSGWSDELGVGVSKWSLHEPLHGKVGMGGWSGKKYEVRRDVRALWPVPIWVEV